MTSQIRCISAPSLIWIAGIGPRLYQAHLGSGYAWRLTAPPASPGFTRAPSMGRSRGNSSAVDPQQPPVPNGPGRSRRSGEKIGNWIPGTMKEGSNRKTLWIWVFSHFYWIPSFEELFVVFPYSLCKKLRVFSGDPDSDPVTWNRFLLRYAAEAR